MAALGGKTSTGGRRLAGLALAAALAVGACTATPSEEEPGAAGLARPDLIVVESFAVSPDEVRRDHGLGPAIREALAGTPRSAAERAAGRPVAAALADRLVVAIQALGLPARAGAGTLTGTVVVIDGQFLAVDEGSPGERVIIGLGAGRRDVRIAVQVVDRTAEPGQTLEAFEVDAQSGLESGMATKGAGAATAGDVAISATPGTGIAITSEAPSAAAAADPERAAQGIAKHLAAFFAKEGWITGE